MSEEIVHIFEVSEQFTQFGAEGLATEPWMVAEGEHSDATLGDVADQMVADLEPGRYVVTLRIEAQRL